MAILLKEINSIIDGKITGDESIGISNLAKIEEAQKGDLTFLYLQPYEKYFQVTKASAILVKEGFNKTRKDITYIEVKEPNKAFAKLVRHFFKPEFPLEGIDKTAFIHPEAELGNNISIGRNVVISKGCKLGDNIKIFHNTVLSDNVVIGDNALIFQNVSIREKCQIGKNVIIHPGTVIGSDGFGYNTDENGNYQKIPQIGIVIIEDDVELGANVTIDRAAIGATIIRKGVKIDNLVQIAHNVEVGENTVISAQTGISGSAKIGKNCILTGQVGMIGHITIADKVIILAQSGISKSISKPGIYFGSPAKELSVAKKIEAHIRNLPGYAEKINLLEKELAALKVEINNLKKQ